MEETNPFHCCASCIHFRVEKEAGKARYRCARLTYETRPDYRFQCWTPSERVKRVMENRKQEQSGKE